jgi:hypothetical protein
MEVSLRYENSIQYGWCNIQYGIDSSNAKVLYKSGGAELHQPGEELSNVDKVISIDISSYTGAHKLAFQYEVADASSYYSAAGRLYISQIKLLL